MLLGSISNRVTRNTGMDKNREMKKKSYVQTVEASWLISLVIDLKYFTVYAVSVKGALPLPPCIAVIVICLVFFINIFLCYVYLFFFGSF